jgi:antirestriction protein ArdC
MCVEMGVISAPRKDHAKYLNSWIQLLSDDKRAFNMAVGKAQQATNYMLNIMGLEIQEVA